MKRKNSSPVTSVNLRQSQSKAYFNYYFTIIVLVVIMVNLAIMVYFQPA